tara:strand:- start:4740 stop:6095 length:1356 start_codon:yes stop_codon:yes gene_type:complete
MSVSSQRASLRKNTINLNRIRRSLISFNRNIRAARLQASEIVKQTGERNKFKGSLISSDEKFFRMRQENIKRKNREDALEASSITGVTKTQGSLLQRSTRGILGRMLDFIGILLIGWTVKNLPRIVKGIESLIQNIRRAVSILTGFMDSVRDTLNGIGTGLENFFFKFRRFDYTLNRAGLLENITKITNSLFLLDKNLMGAFLKFERDPDLNKAIEDDKKNKNKNPEKTNEDDITLDLEKDVTKKIGEELQDEKTEKDYEEAFNKPFNEQGKKTVLDLERFFNNNKDNKKEEIDVAVFDDVERQLNDLEERYGGIESQLTKDLDAIKGIKVPEETNDMIKFLGMDIDNTFNVAKQAISDFKIAYNKEQNPKGRKPPAKNTNDDLAFNPMDRNMDFGRTKSKRDTIFIIEKPVNGSGVNVASAGGGNGRTNIIRTDDSKLLNNLQSAGLKFT